MAGDKVILVTGSTGRQGGAVAKHLLNAGWKVRALTRNPDQPKAKELKESGADVIKGDLDKPEEIRLFFDDIYGVYSVQNPWITGLEKETEHGIRVAELAAEAGVQHLVYSSAGPGTEDTGVPHFNSKVPIEKKIKELGIPYTILRPAGFMELMSDKDFVPPLMIWNVTGKMLGEDFPLSWISCDDVGAVALKAFSNPEEFKNKEIVLVGDIKSMKECKEIYTSVNGKKPLRIPAPVWLFKLMQKDLWLMHQWMKSNGVSPEQIEATRQIHPGVMSVETWMKNKFVAA